MRVDWICYLRDEPLIPYEDLVQGYYELAETGENMTWIQERANNFLTECEVEELKIYLKRKYDFSMELEEFIPPLKVNELSWFKEKYVNNTIVLSDNDEPFKLSVGVLGMVSPFKRLATVPTVGEFIQEVDRQLEK
jgi:hypothetical protein